MFKRILVWLKNPFDFYWKLSKVKTKKTNNGIETQEIYTIAIRVNKL